MAIFDDDVKMLLPDAPAVIGMETIRSIYRTGFDSFDVDLTITLEEVHAWGDFAFSWDNWKGSMKPKDGSKPVEFDNKVMIIYKNQPDDHGRFGVSCAEAISL